MIRPSRQRTSPRHGLTEHGHEHLGEPRGRGVSLPVAIHPTIAQLEDEGLVRIESEHGRKLVVLTEAGRSYSRSRARDLSAQRAPAFGFVLEGSSLLSEWLFRRCPPVDGGSTPLIAFLAPVRASRFALVPGARS